MLFKDEMKNVNSFWQSYIIDLEDLDLLLDDCFASNSESVTADIRRFKAIYISPLIRDKAYIQFATKIANCHLESVERTSLTRCVSSMIDFFIFDTIRHLKIFAFFLTYIKKNISQIPFRKGIQMTRIQLITDSVGTLLLLMWKISGEISRKSIVYSVPNST